MHVGALRGVLIHDAIFRTLREKGIEARYLFGVDDFDPVDEIPKGEDEHFGKYIGWPLCNIDEFRHELEINLIAPYELARKAAAWMIA